MIEIFDDIRSLYQFKAPCPELKDHIEFFSETSAEATARFIDAEEFTVRLFPSYTPTIWINLGSPYRIKNGKENKHIPRKTDILVLRDTTLERHNLITDHIFTVKFHPLGFESIFGFSQAKIGSDMVNVSEIIDPAILKKLKNMAGLEERIVFLENWFIEKLHKNLRNQHDLRGIRLALDNHFQSGLEMKNYEIADQLCVSEKTFYRHFKNSMGTNPKTYFSIARARTALTAYKKDKSAFSPYDFGYYDFGHFSKDVVKFTGSLLSGF